jgi:phosphoesterase RecJ-like protein
MDSKLTTFGKIAGLLQVAERVLLVADGKPDGDSIGSSSAMYTWLKREGKPVTVFCALPIPSTLLYLDGAHDFTHDPAIFEQPFDLIITFDASDIRHAGIENLLPKIPCPYQLVVIDHHATNTRYGHLNAVWTDACSTAELVYQFFTLLGIPVDSKMATSLLTGILTDTSCFSNAGTTSQGMEAAGHLCSLGARHPEILRQLVQNKSMPTLKLWGLALARLNHNTQFNITSTYFLLEDLKEVPEADEEAMEGLSNFLNAVCGDAETMLVLRELPNRTIKGSFRSIRRDISKLARFFGGGGHKKAAGFTIPGRLKVDEKGQVHIAR